MILHCKPDNLAQHVSMQRLKRAFLAQARMHAHAQGEMETLEVGSFVLFTIFPPTRRCTDLHLITETACLVSRNFLHEQCHAAAYSKVDAAHTEFEKVGETDVGFGMCVLDKPALKRHVLQCGIENNKQVQKE